LLLLLLFHQFLLACSFGFLPFWSQFFRSLLFQPVSWMTCLPANTRISHIIILELSVKSSLFAANKRPYHSPSQLLGLHLYPGQNYYLSIRNSLRTLIQTTLIYKQFREFFHQ